MGMAVQVVLGTGAYQFDVGFDEQQWENNVTDTAGQPDGDKQSYKNSEGRCDCHISLNVHKQIR